MQTPTPPDTAIILVNLGTPDAPTEKDVKRYLKQFLSDPRVIEIPKLIWAIILNLFVLPRRAKKVAHAYQSIWQQDSPIRFILQQQAELLQQRLNQDFPNQVSVYPAMTYGNPALLERLHLLQQQSVENVIILPLYPQYSATTTGAVFDVVAKWGQTQRHLPSLCFIKDYYKNPLYIKALAKSIQQFQQQHGKPEKLLFSFHGIPKINSEKGDPYADRCRETAQMVAQVLQLTDDEWLCSFQSRFGTQEWVKPYTDETLQTWGEQGIQSVQVLSPAFSADCLETLEELAVENKQIFINAGGKSYHYIPALNTDVLHLDLLQQLVSPYIKKTHI